MPHNPLFFKEIPCGWCGKIVLVRKCHWNDFKGCSRRCASRVVTQRNVPKICIVCGAEYLSCIQHAKKTKYCGKRCAEIQSKITRMKEKRTCQHCGAAFYRPSTYSKKQKYCSVKCYADVLTKETSPQTAYRIKAFSYKDRVCERCGYREIPEILVIHHQDRDRTNNGIENLVVLCPNCHEAEHFLKRDGRYRPGPRIKGWKPQVLADAI